MIRPFDLRDLRLVQRLETTRVILDSRTALVEAGRPFQEALVAYLFGGRGTPTVVMRERHAGASLRAFGQWRVIPGRPLAGRRGRRHARLVTLACSPPGHESWIWPRMLEALIEQAGRQGAHVCLAEVEDGGRCFELLQQTDFSVYARQELWRLKTPVRQQQSVEHLLRPKEPADEWAVEQLVANTVPPLIQQVEPADSTHSGLLWERAGDLLAFVCVKRGPHGTWVQPFFHPRAEESARSIVEQVAAACSPSPDEPLYCCVRRYQQWLNGPLLETGFEPLGDQAVMVRHIAVRVARPALSPVPVREKGLEVTSPIAHSTLGRKT